MDYQWLQKSEWSVTVHNLSDHKADWKRADHSKAAPYGTSIVDGNQYRSDDQRNKK